MGRVLASHARATIVTVSAAAAVLLSGCSDGAGAQPGPSRGGPTSSATSSASAASSSPTTTASPTGTASVAVPAAARAHTDEGAKAFARFYFSTASRAVVRPDTSQLRALSSASCTGCSAFVELIEKYKGEGTHIDRDALRVTDVSVRPSSNEAGIPLDVLATDGPKKLVGASGVIVQEFQQSKLFFEVTVRWAGGRWTMHQLKAVQ